MSTRQVTFDCILIYGAEKTESGHAMMQKALFQPLMANSQVVTLKRIS